MLFELYLHGFGKLILIQKLTKKRKYYELQKIILSILFLTTLNNKISASHRAESNNDWWVKPVLICSVIVNLKLLYDNANLSHHISILYNNDQILQSNITMNTNTTTALANQQLHQAHTIQQGIETLNQMQRKT